MVVSLVGSSIEADGVITRPFGLLPLSLLPSLMKVICNCAGLLPVKMATRDGVRWGLFRMTQNNDELVRCINQLLDLGQAACVVRPRSTSR